MHAVEKIDYDFGSERGRHGTDRFLASRFAGSDGTERVYRSSDGSSGGGGGGGGSW